MRYIMKLLAYLEETYLLVKESSKKNESEAKGQTVDYWAYY